MTSSSNCSSNYFSRKRPYGFCSRTFVLVDLLYGITSSPRMQPAMVKPALAQERNSTEDAEAMHTKKEVADYLRVSLATINRLIRVGQIQTLKIGRSVRITDKALKSFLASQEVRR